MTPGTHPLCRKPSDCRCYRAGERLCLTCSGKTYPKPEDSEVLRKMRRSFGATQAKRMLLEKQHG